MAVTFTINYASQSKVFTTDRVDYEDLWEFSQSLFGILPDEEIFIYTVPNDHSNMVRLCPRLLDAIFVSAEKNPGVVRVSLKVFVAESFVTREVQLVASSAAQPLIKIPKAKKQHTGKFGTAKSYNSKGNNSLTSSTASQLGVNVSPAHFAGPALTSSQPAQSWATKVSQPAAGTKGPQPVVAARTTPPKPAPKITIRSVHADNIDKFRKLYSTGLLSEYNVSIEPNPATFKPFEHKDKDNYSLSLVFKATGTLNIGKEFSFCKIAGNGAPSTFSLPILKPQVTRTISVTMEFAGDEEHSFWAIKKDSGEWVGQILGITVLKLQKNLLLKVLDFTQASTELDKCYFTQK